MAFDTTSAGKPEPPSSPARPTLRRLVLDVLKPHEPNILAIAKALAVLPGVDGVDITVYEIDAKVENVKITLEGTDLEFARIRNVIHDMGGAIHSIDKVSTGRVIVEEAPTPQD
ncbi:DUF211 domain-containing protein [Dissulfurirhabdus thermomarina]|uniref:DUF211 domain-containing protein n=2 Tax=Dissulfurirhabdus thermomarina TaxID=1765737 RepID=A0A6N9TSL6_DISTH|nr:DUF211 domain-containing protein [Dissulfurirhabdus thermomarina]NDY43400.1 DUF211 domain-containing protein [Dissulfurirhabdus thermomarina]NMX23640.1 DUF211 domain-containing protein [Dissulfurirhabdus thermomarina]